MSIRRASKKIQKRWLKENSDLKILDLGCSSANYWPEANHFADIDDFSKDHNIFQFNDLIGLAYEYFVNDYSDGGGGAEGQFFTERPLMNMLQ